MHNPFSFLHNCSASKTTDLWPGTPVNQKAIIPRCSGIRIMAERDHDGVKIEKKEDE
jgi:hypothetical protein